MNDSTALNKIIDASIDYPARPEYVEKARDYLKGLGGMSSASLVDFLKGIPTEEERAEAALAFLKVGMRGDW